jgi:DNA-binding response OmpR family regulator
MQPNKILIIDNNEAGGNYLPRYLRGAGFETVSPQPGVPAMEAIRQMGPDLIILASESINEASLAVVRAIRADSELYRLPVIMIGTAFDPVEAIRVLENGADEYLARSIKPLELGARVRAVLRRCYAQVYPALTQPVDDQFETDDAVNAVVLHETSLASELKTSLVLVGIVMVGAGLMAALLFWFFF